MTDTAFERFERGPAAILLENCGVGNAVGDRVGARDRGFRRPVALAPTARHDEDGRHTVRVEAHRVVEAAGEDR